MKQFSLCGVNKPEEQIVVLENLNMYKAVIIEDNLADQFILKVLCQQIGQIDVLDSFSNAEKALKFIDENKPDFVFLDVHLPQFSGIKIASLLPRDIPVIFVTGDKDSAYDAFQLSAVDYVLKPFTYDTLLAAFNKVKEVISHTRLKSNSWSKKIFVKVGKELLPLKIRDILYVEAQGDYILINTKDSEYFVHNTLKSFLDELPENIFFRIHRSFVVNLMLVEKITNSSLFCATKEVPISKYKRKQFNIALEKMSDLQMVS